MHMLSSVISTICSSNILSFPQYFSQVYIRLQCIQYNIRPMLSQTGHFRIKRRIILLDGCHVKNLYLDVICSCRTCECIDSLNTIQCNTIQHIQYTLSMMSYTDQQSSQSRLLYAKTRWCSLAYNIMQGASK